MPKIAGPIGKVILTTLGIAGVVVVAVVAPNIFQIFGQFKYSKRQYKRSIKSLKNRKLISIQKRKNKFHIRLTKKGRTQLSYHNLYNIRLKKEFPWDKKWRLVIFDIPIDHNQDRDELTCLLKELGFKMLQKSAWICPWPCEQQINLITATLQIDTFVKIILSEKIPDEEKFKKYFNVT